MPSASGCSGRVVAVGGTSRENGAQVTPTWADGPGGSARREQKKSGARGQGSTVEPGALPGPWLRRGGEGAGAYRGKQPIVMDYRSGADRRLPPEKVGGGGGAEPVDGGGYGPGPGGL